MKRHCPVIHLVWEAWTGGWTILCPRKLFYGVITHRTDSCTFATRPPGRWWRNCVHHYDLWHLFRWITALLGSTKRLGQPRRWSVRKFRQLQDRQQLSQGRTKPFPVPNPLRRSWKVQLVQSPSGPCLLSKTVRRRPPRPRTDGLSHSTTTRRPRKWRLQVFRRLKAKSKSFRRSKRNGNRCAVTRMIRRSIEGIRRMLLIRQVRSGLEFLDLSIGWVNRAWSIRCNNWSRSLAPPKSLFYLMV